MFIFLLQVITRAAGFHVIIPVCLSNQAGTLVRYAIEGTKQSRDNFRGHIPGSRMNVENKAMVTIGFQIPAFFFILFPKPKYFI